MSTKIISFDLYLNIVFNDIILVTCMNLLLVKFMAISPHCFLLLVHWAAVVRTAGSLRDPNKEEYGLSPASSLGCRDSHSSDVSSSTSIYTIYRTYRMILCSFLCTSPTCGRASIRVDVSCTRLEWGTEGGHDPGRSASNS